MVVQLLSRGMWFRGKDIIAFVMDLQFVSKTNKTLDAVFAKKFMFLKSISRDQNFEFIMEKQRVFKLSGQI